MMINLLLHFLLIAASSPVTAKKCPPSSAEMCTTKDCVIAAGRMLSNMNTSVDPCEDFYTFNCGGWIKDRPLSDSTQQITVFSIMATRVYYQLKDLLNEPQSDQDPAAVNKIKVMNKACLNQSQVFNTTKPRVMATLDDWSKWPIITQNWTGDGFNWTRVEATLQNSPAVPSSMSGVMGIAIERDFTRNTSDTKIFITQCSTVISKTYLRNPWKYRNVLSLYKSFIGVITTQLGTLSKQEISQQADEIIAFEGKIANISSTSADLGAKVKFTNMSLGELNKRTNYSCDWVLLFQLVFENVTTIDENENVIIYDERFVFQICKLITETEKKVLANYLIWKYIYPILIYLTPQTQSVYYSFTLQLYGSGQPPRWAVCLSDIDQSMDMALGRQYVTREFSDKSKSAVESMGNEILQAFITALSRETWMDDETRAFAIKKAKSIIGRYGYPAWIKDDTALNQYYEDVEISPKDYFFSLGSAMKSLVNKVLESLRLRPVDVNKWVTSPQTINAFYDVLGNSMNFPAAILQAPFFYPNGLKAMMFGGIGSVIGHEITHGFDNQGRNYDGTGALFDWWTNSSEANFLSRSECFADQYSQFCPAEVDPTCVDGNWTLGENIADCGGLNTAYAAYKHVIKQTGTEKHLPGLQNYTGDQIFFMAFAQDWCESIRPDQLEYNLLTDDHSPGKYRVLGSIANSPDFRRAFNCKKPARQDCDLWGGDGK